MYFLGEDLLTVVKQYYPSIFPICAFIILETTLEPSDRAFQIRNQQDINDNPSEHDTVESVKDSSNGSSLDLLDDLDQAESEKEQHGSPLFLTLMCSVRSKDIEITSMTVRNLPTCLSMYTYPTHFFICNKLLYDIDFRIDHWVVQFYLPDHRI